MQIRRVRQVFRSPKLWPLSWEKSDRPYSNRSPDNPLHGATLQHMVECLADHYGWAELGHLIPIRCFTHDPSVSSSLKFLRRTPWARAKVEALYVETWLRARGR